MARVLSRVVGHADTIRVLLQARRDGHLGQTLLFAGPAGVGKRLVALGLAQALVCERSDEACGECGPCLRVEKQQSESLLVVEPSGVNIKIEQSREILEFLSLQKLGRARVVLIDQAHHLNPQAANALLKALEEPPDETYFIMVAANAGALLPTIRSRAQLIRFQPLTLAELKELTGAEDWVLRSAQGSAEAALRWRDAEADWQELRSQALKTLAGAIHGDEPTFDRIKDLAKDKAAALFVTETWQKALRDMAVASLGSKAYINSDAAELMEWGARLPPESLHALGALSLELEQDLLRNVDKTLAFETFWLACRRAGLGEPVAEY